MSKKKTLPGSKGSRESTGFQHRARATKRAKLEHRKQVAETQDVQSRLPDLFRYAPLHRWDIGREYRGVDC